MISLQLKNALQADLEDAYRRGREDTLAALTALARGEMPQQPLFDASTFPTFPDRVTGIAAQRPVEEPAIDDSVGWIDVPPPSSNDPGVTSTGLSAVKRKVVGPYTIEQTTSGRFEIYKGNAYVTIFTERLDAVAYCESKRNERPKLEVVAEAAS